MKLTTTNPEVLNFLGNFAGGLCPIKRDYDSRSILIVKSSREIAQTARLQAGFRFYWVQVNAEEAATYGLLSAFLDDDDEPLVIRTPLFDDEVTPRFLSLLSSDCFYVHFFDEQNREILGFRAENPSARRFRGFPKTMRFLNPTLERERRVLDDLQIWFGNRSESDDENAFDIHLRERLFPDELKEHPDNPGDLDEPDIAATLERSFGHSHVFSNPIRVDNDREFVDVLVMTANTVLLVQAKDSPISETVLSRHIRRKRASAIKQIQKASRQLKGAIKLLMSNESVEVISQGQKLQVTMSGYDVFGLVIVNELFDPDRPECSSTLRAVSDETGVPCVLLDHAELQQLTYFRKSEGAFLAAVREIFAVLKTHGEFPRSRFGLRKGKSVVYKVREKRKPKSSNNQDLSDVSAIRSSSIATPLSVDPKIGESTNTAYRRDSASAWLRVVVEREDVEALDVSGTALILSRVLDDKNALERYRGKVSIEFLGYSEDSRELYEIPEVRDFCTKLDEVFPYWFYFLSPDRVTLGVIASCLCQVETLRPGIIRFSPDLIDFLTRHYYAQNWLFENYGLDESINEEISRGIIRYFTKSETV